jgi:hypothetical protein
MVVPIVETHTLRSSVNIVTGLKYQMLHMRLKIQATKIQAKMSNTKFQEQFFFHIDTF